ncbi:MAG: hypothetical protein Q9218_007353 [Villophora microphyllina]
MIVYWVTYLILSNIAQLPVLCHKIMPRQTVSSTSRYHAFNPYTNSTAVVATTPPPTTTKSTAVSSTTRAAHCNADGICATDTGDHYSAEPLEDYLSPDSTIRIKTELKSMTARYGDILVNEAEDIPRIRSAMLLTAISRMTWTPVLFGRVIADSYDGKGIGYMIVDRPIPDPDTRFGTLANDTLLAGMPSDLRSLVDPRSLIPSPTKGCNVSECIMIIPVCVPESHDHMPLANATSVCRRLLLRPRAHEYGLSFNTKESVTFCSTTRDDYVRDAAIARLRWLPALIFTTRDPSHVYVVYQPMQAFNMCRTWVYGGTKPFTTNYPPNALSTLEYRPNAPPATKSLNTADLPCPPTEVAELYDSHRPYSPVLLADIAGSKVGGYFDCEAAAVRDPAHHASRVRWVSGPNDVGFV